MQLHVKRRETAKTESRLLGTGYLRLAVEGMILTETLKYPALDAVAFVEGFWVVLLAGRSQL